MRLCFDLDGVICETKTESQSYNDVAPMPGAINTLKLLKQQGHYIIIATARHMKTCNGNLGLILAKQGKNLFEWLDRHEIPYDEVWFGKPLADCYIDDKGYKFTTWDKVYEDNKNE